ncbi:hypothetical protein C8E03_10835 [Lachnotalea glycerini]|uniref:Uncharacterized protein n=1 Tax=Lachnotalea glycerini TaxID=1763509 RepID=A0A318EPK9_9FIRM|nr:hypothetical protein [Lachnotalea glycerini]PXV88313.1 hypothetical protein C8E03_10835 [Lachnotalea glycerini]
MSEETILKNSFLGGYKKRDVIQYVDDLLEENEKKVKGMEEQITFLIKENKRLKAKTINEKPIPFPAEKGIESGNKISLKQQMELPEGSYMVSKDRVVSLPEPLPIYQTKNVKPSQDKADTAYLRQMEEETASNIAATKECVMEEPAAREYIPEEPAARGRVPEETAARGRVPEETAAREYIPEEPAARERVPEETAAREYIPEESAARERITMETEAKERATEELALEEPIMEESIMEELIMEEPVSKMPVSKKLITERQVIVKQLEKAVGKEQRLQYEAVEIERLKGELLTLKAMLKAQKQEKLVLQSKLDYSNELLLSLFKMK